MGKTLKIYVIYNTENISNVMCIFSGRRYVYNNSYYVCNIIYV